MTNQKGSGWKKPQSRRKPRAVKQSHKSASESRKGSEARGRLKQRIIALESRMVVLERLLESINTPESQAYADRVREEADKIHYNSTLSASHLEEE